jgi:hypothetical protein
MNRTAKRLTLCACFCGGLPGCARESSEAARVGPPWFEEVAAQRGLVFQHTSGHGSAFWMPEIMGGGAALVDADGDGDLDAFLVQGGRLEPDSGPGTSHALFENTGEGRFRELANTLPESRGYGMGVAAGDADGDGDTDLYVTQVGPNVLLENEGGLRFADVSERAAVGHRGWSTSAAFFDADRDGDLDLFVANYLDWSFEGELPCLNALSQRDYCSPKNYKTPARGVLYANRGQGRFEDVSRASGIGAKRGTGLGVAVGDVDGDGWLDVFVANDGMANLLWKNQGGLVFAESALLSGCGVDVSGQEKAGMGVVLADLDRDRDLDLLVCNLAGESDSLYLNEHGFFVDKTAISGLGPVSKAFTRFGVGCFDFDHDGELDLFEATGRVQSATEPRSADVYAEENLLFRGLGPGLFTEVPLRGGVAAPLIATSRAAAFGDVDGDGAIDVLVVNRDGPAHLLHNCAAKHGHWILLARARGLRPRRAGASLELAVGERVLRREVASASSYLAASDPRVHAGLGAETRVARATVRWADGAREAFGPLEADRVHELRRGRGQPAD